MSPCLTRSPCTVTKRRDDSKYWGVEAEEVVPTPIVRVSERGVRQKMKVRGLKNTYYVEYGTEPHTGGVEVPREYRG